MKKQYKALRFIGAIYKVLGIIAGVITILIALGLCAASVMGGSTMNSMRGYLGSNAGIVGMFGGLLGGLLLSLIAILYGGVMALTLYGAGEGVYLFLALEEHTRTTAELLQQQINR
jgi:hypothetical protein